MWRILTIGLFMSGCDMVFGVNHLQAGGGDAGSGVTVDAPPDGFHVRRWQPPVLLFEAHDDDDPTLTGDMLEIYFNRDADIYWATRTDLQSPWTTPVRNNELSSNAVDTSPKISRDGKTMFFASERMVQVGNEDVWMATRANRTSPWTGLVKVSELNTSDVDSAASPSLDMLELVMHSKREDGDHYNLYRTTRTSTMAMWKPPMLIDELNTPRESSNPVLTDDDLTIYFDSNRTVATTQSDLYIAHRATPTSMFGAPTPVPDINGVKDDRDPWISSDETVLVFASNRGGLFGIYMSVFE